MTDNELDQLMQRVLLDAIKSDCEKENGSFTLIYLHAPVLQHRHSSLYIDSAL